MPPHERRELDQLRKVDALLLRHHLLNVRHSPLSKIALLTIH
jgi:hypothetical protein